MPGIHIRSVPSDLHERLRSRAAAAQVSLSAYVLHLLERDAGQPSTEEWLASLADREPVPDVDVTALLDETRGREQHFARVLRR